MSGESSEQMSAPFTGPPDATMARLRPLVAHDPVAAFEDLLLRRLDSTATVVHLEAALREAARLLGRDIGVEVDCSSEPERSKCCPPTTPRTRRQYRLFDQQERLDPGIRPAKPNQALFEPTC